MKKISILAGVALFVSASANAQQQPEAAQPEVAPQAPPTTQPTAAPQPADDGLQVPATLAPLSPDTTSVKIAPAPVAVPVPFGHRGQWVVMGSSNRLSIRNETFSNSSATFFNVGGGLGIDKFVVDNVSLGFDAEATYGDEKGYGATALTETKSTAFSGGVRFGFNVPLGGLFSWYPRLTLSLYSSHSTTKPVSSSVGAPLPPPASESSVGPAANLYAPLLVHPAPHFVLGFGPRLQHDFGVTRGGQYDGSQPTLLSGQFVVGGWWGGAASDGGERDPTNREHATRPKTADHVFGEEGLVVLTLATDASVSYLSYSRSKASRTDMNLDPGFDYFLEENVSVGVDAFISHSSGTALDPAGTTAHFSSTAFGVAPRLGANLALTELVSIWLRGEIGYGTVDQSIASAEGTNQHTRTRTWLYFSAPLLLHPSSHFFVGAGPSLFHELSNKDQYQLDNAATSLGVNLVLGGWFSALAAPRGNSAAL